jgi:hypothetical protein
MKELLSFLVLVIISTFQMYSQNSVALRIEKIDSKLLKPGETVIVGVYSEKKTDGIGGFQIYIEFDRSVLEFVNVLNKHTEFEKEWLSNNSDCCFAANWLTLEKGGLVLIAGEKLFDLEFTYMGGETNIDWQFEQIIKDNKITQGQTMFIDSQAKEIELELKNGCVCKMN